MKTDLTAWEIGPFHEALPGQMKLRMKLDGEVIVSCRAESGFLHRGLEKAFEAHSWHSAVVYADRLDPECAAFGEFALCSAVEEICEITVPDRAKSIRITLLELTRISSHLLYLARLAKASGSETLEHYVLRDRERVLDLFELLTGARFTLNFMRYGGVQSDVTEGFIERVLETCDLLRVRLKEYNDVFTFNQAFVRRTAGLAVLTQEQITRFGVTGPNARASGSSVDMRKALPGSGYEGLDFQVPVGELHDGVSGDVHSRFLIRLREISESVEILKQVVEITPGGEFQIAKIEKDFAVPPGEAYVRIESSRGLLGCHVVSDGGLRPDRVQFRPPSVGSLLALSELLPGTLMGDLPIVVASLDISLPEVDR